MSDLSVYIVVNIVLQLKLHFKSCYSFFLLSFPFSPGKQSHVPPSEEDVVAGPSSREQFTEEAVAGSSSREQFTEEAVAGPSSMQERHIKDVVYSSVQRHLRTAAAECSLTLKISALKSQVSKLRAKVKQLQCPKVSKGQKELAKKELVMEELQAFASC